ncbi:MAG: helix-turn-helix domain-containing protein [Rhodopirellula sp.]|nr:helix-turn-helix domain-containing protein [Rhodopirellula sp.]
MANGLKLSEHEIKSAFTAGPWAEQFPPVLTIDQAAELLQIPKSTLYDWRSRGLLNSCSRRAGKRVRFFRDRLIQQIFNEGLNSND